MPAGTPYHVRCKAPARRQRKLGSQLENSKVAVFLSLSLRLDIRFKHLSLFPEIVEASRQSQNTLVPEGSGTNAQRVVSIHTRQILMDVLHRGAHHQIRLAVGIFQLRHISQALADIRRICRLPGPLHVARRNEIAEVGVEDAATEGALQRVARGKLVIDAQRVAVVMRGVLPLLFRL